MPGNSKTEHLYQVAGHHHGSHVQGVPGACALQRKRLHQIHTGQKMKSDQSESKLSNIYKLHIYLSPMTKLLNGHEIPLILVNIQAV